MGESEKETEAATPRNANSAVKRSRVFVVVDLMCDLMGANRTTFECGSIRLVGQGTEEKRVEDSSLLAEEIDEEFGNA